MEEKKKININDNNDRKIRNDKKDEKDDLEHLEEWGSNVPNEKLELFTE